jgi:hypothetical protein
VKVGVEGMVQSQQSNLPGYLAHCRSGRTSPCDWRYVIESDDDMDNFKSDYEAEALVRNMSRNGSEVHKPVIAEML